MNTARQIKGIKEHFKNCQKSLSKHDLGNKEMSLFLKDKSGIEEKIKSLDLKNVQISDLKEIDKEIKKIDNFLNRIRKDRGTLIDVIKEFTHWINDSKRKISLKIDDLKLKINTRKKKKNHKSEKIYQIIEFYDEIDNGLLKILENLMRNIYLYKKKFSDIKEIQKNVDQILNSSETNIPKLKSVSQNFYHFLKNKKKFEIEINLTEDCKFKTISENIGLNFISNTFKNEKDNNFQIHLLQTPAPQKKNAKTQNSKFMKHFRASFENMIKDEDMRPTPKIKEKLGKLDEGLFCSSNLVNHGTFSKFDLECLFVVFYFCEDDYERLLVAKELKKREWSFHRKYLVWFKRHGAPKEIHSLYEKGDFLVFDNEEKWKIKKKKDFLFEYKHLENDF